MYTIKNLKAGIVMFRMCNEVNKYNKQNDADTSAFFSM